MDSDLLVEGGAEGLRRIAKAFRKAGLPIVGIYLIKVASTDGFEEWVIRLVAEHKTPDQGRRMIHELVRLRRDGSLPNVDQGIRFDVVSLGDPEASRVLEYARRLGGPPVVIRDAMWKGLFVEYALVAEAPHASFAQA